MMTLAKAGAVQEAAKITPPVAVTSYAFLTGMGLETWVLAATLIYTVLLVIHKALSIIWDVRERKGK